MAVSSSLVGRGIVRVSHEPGVGVGPPAGAAQADVLARLSDAYRPALVDFCTRLTGSPDDAEDLASDALLRAAASFHTFRPTAAGSLRAWLFRIALNLVRDRLRRRARERRALEHLTRTRPLTSPAADQAAIWTVLDCLPLPFRAAAVLRLRYQLDYDEIARILRCRPATARWRVHRALRTLAEMMSDAR